jgi:hypothetical protein
MLTLAARRRREGYINIYLPAAVVGEFQTLEKIPHSSSEITAQKRRLLI